MKVAARYEITKIRVNPAGEKLEELEINHEAVDLGKTVQDNKEATIDVSSYSEPVEVTPSSGKTSMKKVTVTLSNVPELESNKAATIDVSTYTEPVEITPTSGKDGMEKATVTLSNIPVSPDIDLMDYRFSLEATGETTLPFFTDIDIPMEIITPDTSINCGGYVVDNDVWVPVKLMVACTDENGLKYTTTYNGVTYQVMLG